jgi:hypothetical protein
MNLEYCKRQIQLSMLRAQWWIASATSGHYKRRKIFHGPASSEGPEFTDEEKLADCLETASRHIENAAEFSEHLTEAEAAIAEVSPLNQSRCETGDAP